MKIKYLGSGGGAGIPELFCSCRICENSRKNGGKEIRNRPLAVINEELCIDLPCDARSSFLQQGFDARKIRYLLITHNHYDHFMSENFFTRPEDWDSLDLFISKGSGAGLVKKCEELQKIKPQGTMRPICYPRVHLVKAFEEFQAGNYSIVPIPANHAPELEAMNFIISYNGIHVLWLHDSGLMREETLRYLQNKDVCFSFVSLDCFLAKGEHAQSDHMNITQCACTVEQLKLSRCVNENTLIYLSHIGHLVNQTHEELVNEARRFRFHVAYDGAEICI